GINRDFHMLAYVPRNPKAGCHKIKVEVDRPNALVFGRNQYCTGQSSSEPLLGTSIGNELEKILGSEKRGKIPLTLHTATFYTRAGAGDADSEKGSGKGAGTARLQISMRFPWKELYRTWDLSQWAIYARIGVMGVVRKKDGTIAA